MSNSWVLELGLQKPPLSMNDRMHHMAKYQHTKRLRRETALLARSMRLPQGLDRVLVEIHYTPGTNRKRDTDNLTATLKPCIDGLMDYGLCLGDDSSHVLSGCAIDPVVKGLLKSRVRLVITDLSAETWARVRA